MDSQNKHLTPLRFPPLYPNHDSQLIIPNQANERDIIKLKEKSILHLPNNPAGQMSTQALALRNLSLSVSFCSYSRSRYGYPTDITSPLNGVPITEHDPAMMSFTINSTDKYDIFHFHAGQTFTRFNYTDLPYLSLFNKKLVMSFWGSEVRRYSLAKLNNPYTRVANHKNFEEKEILGRLNVLSRYIDAVIVPDYELFEYVKGYFKKIYIIPAAIDYKDFSPSYPNVNIKKPLIVHAPSNQYLKGTDYVQKAISNLKKYVDFEYVQVEKMANQQALNWIRKADIVVDQLCLGIYGTVAIESMLFGKPVISFIREDILKKYPSGLPVVSANPNTLEKKLYKLIKKPKLRYKLGVKGRSYAVNNHDPFNIARQLVNVYNDL
ncbi:glycosyltransferase involved in cell wall biosynthesis [Evansella vedderi]|uniref:Glycosyltransferase involved in cell wall biosynthesis n=1 Tax=Evansella vedderi TaxID=38282 RepID=A0ABT9ZVU2_9BACI|nr:glycosyltransferase family 4 protein [Evansella vedderi]MDQ0255334.1 glycosyltransferase involved in cell wall biosynthesis [Evansella vedderi]